MSNFEWILAYADTWGPLIPLTGILIVFRNNKMPEVVTVLLFYLLVSSFLFGYSNYLADQKINNLFVYHIFTVVELVCLLLLFRTVIRSRSVKQTILYLLIILSVLLVFNSLFLESPRSLNSNASTVEFLVIIFFCLVYYFELANTNDILNFSKNPVFWIVSAFFIYHSICLVVFAFYKYAAVQYRSFILNFWLVQVIIYILKNIIITKGILCFKPPK